MSEHIAEKQIGRHTRWASFENPKAEKGCGGWENNGAKGHPSSHILAGETKTLMEYSGPGEINRIWITLGDRSAAALRGLILRCYWDSCEKPAVEVPLGDFMCCGTEMVAFESEFFANPEGRSLNCYIPMPFRSGAKITLTNAGQNDIPWLFYDVDFTSFDSPQENLYYFHSWFSRSNPVELEKDHVVLPRISGEGRFLGAYFAVNANPIYEDTWWGEGEVKIYLDGDREFPTLVGTGTEDYIGTAWGQSLFHGRYQGCPTANPKEQQWGFYRFHIKDPVYFSKEISVSIQDIGGGTWQAVHNLVQNAVPLTPTTCDKGIKGGLQHLYKKTVSLPHEGWINFYRQDDFATTAYFYCDHPFTDLPRLQCIEELLDGFEFSSKQQENNNIVLIAE